MKKLLLLSALFIFACSTDSEGNPCIYEPTLTTQAATDITETSATLNGVISIVSENCDVPNNTEQGFVYSTEIQPTLEDIQVNVNGTNISTTIESLEPNTTYYVRAFLTNTLGEFYSNEVSFSTEELDLTPPVITIIGDNPLEINIGEDYTEFGATATDDIDGDITQDIIIDYSNLNTTLAGSYTVTYSVSDLSNNSTSEQRVVVVIDNSIGNCDDVPYNSIVYGTQEWTVENACHITYRDGTPIPEVTDLWGSGTGPTGAWAYYDNDPTKPRLYNWYAVMGIHDEASLLDASLRKEFAPEGWHVPTDAEWTRLEEYLIANGYNFNGTSYVCSPCTVYENLMAKSMASTTGWENSSNAGAVGSSNQLYNNSSGFNAFPVGYIAPTGQSRNEGAYTHFWTSTELNPIGNLNSYAWAHGLANALSSTLRDDMLLRFGLSVRFVRD